MSTVRLETRDGVAEIVLANPKRHNAISVDTLQSLIRIGRALRKDRDLRAVILRAEGPSFCSGLDIPSFMRTPVSIFPHFLRPFWRRTNDFQEVAWVWRRLPVPVFAVLHGRCYGAGLQIALACDFRFATPDCELSIMEAKWGLVPDMSGTVTLRELMPLDQAKLLSMTGEVFGADRALALGLVTALGEDPLAMARAQATRIASRSPDAVASTKFLFQRAWPASVAAAFRLERRYQLPLLVGRNQRIAVRRVNGEDAPYWPRRVQR